MRMRRRKAAASPSSRRAVVVSHGADHLLDDLLQAVLLLPRREMGAELPEIGVVADVVADARGLRVREPWPPPGSAVGQLHALQQAGGVLAAAAQVVHLARPGVLGE